jgi:NADH-quinone oxidoreductase subunit N
MNQVIDYHAILPEMILSGTVLVVLVADLFLDREHKSRVVPLGFLGVIAALAATLTLIGEDRTTFGGMFVIDSFAVVFKVFFLTVAAVVLAISIRYFREGRYYQGEYYFLLLTAFLGCILMPSSRDLLMLFISLELVSAPGFLIAAFRKSDPRSNEAGVKFFLIGVLSSAVMLYGMSMIYGVTGTTNLVAIGEKLAGALPGTHTLVLASILFVIAGFAFKVSAVPFQFWAPDTYEGAPLPVAAFLSVASKAAGFAGLIQLMFVGFIHQAEFWTPIFAALSIATMTFGNLLAIQQRQIVRLLAYSSIAHAGYMLLPFSLAGQTATIDRSAISAIVLYILFYGVMNLGAFAVVIGAARERPGILISDFAGLIRLAPALAVAMTIFMVSLAGIPPTGGFWAKFFIFRVAIERGGIGIWLAAVMVVNSVVSLFYYVAISRQMVVVEGEPASTRRAPVLVAGVVLLAAAAVFVLGIFPNLFADLFPLSALARP